MRDSRGWLIAGAAVAALLLWPRRAAASINPGADVTFPPDAQWHDAPADWMPDQEALDLLGVGLPGVDFADPSMVDTMDLADDPQIAAFLYAIRRSEHSDADVAAGVDYATFFGGARFTDMSDHPVNTGELRGVPLSLEQCRKAGFPSGKCVSTAAGAYQFIKPTWDRIRAQAPRLEDFSPRSQDRAAARLLRELGVHRLLSVGDFQGAVFAASTAWASLPGSKSGQPQRTMAYVSQAFNQGGGTFA